MPGQSQPLRTIPVNQHKELWSVAYVRAVAAAAGYDVVHYYQDLESRDLTIAGLGARGNTLPGQKLDIQAKSTAHPRIVGDTIRYDLRSKNYNDLRDERVFTPRILVLVTMPERIDHWISTTPSFMVMRRCAYWVSLRGAPATPNRSSITVSVPLGQRFTVRGLDDLMGRVAEGGQP